LKNPLANLTSTKSLTNIFFLTLYPSATSIAIAGNIEALVPMTEMRYLEGKPVLLFSGEKQEARSRKQENYFKDINNFVFKDSSWQDLAVELACVEKWEIEEKDWQIEETKDKESYLVWQNTFKLKEPGIYEIWIDYGKKKTEWEIKIDRENIVQFKIPKESYSKYIRIAQVEIEKAGKHTIKIKNQKSKIKDTSKENKFPMGQAEQNLKIILVNKEERENAEEFVWRKINQLGSKLCYIFSGDGKFYIP
jgi:hypothetical protein